jgi:hypothetical protein
VRVVGSGIGNGGRREHKPGRHVRGERGYKIPRQVVQKRLDSTLGSQRAPCEAKEYLEDHLLYHRNYGRLDVSVVTCSL